MRQGLPAHPSSVARARRLVRQRLEGTPLEPLAETAELVVSEVVTNAIVHTGDGIEMDTVLDDTGLRVEVADSSKHLPVVASYDAMALTGRGLHLVAELTDQWGVEPRADGKVFWFRLGLSVRDGGPPRPVDAEPSASSTTLDEDRTAEDRVADAGRGNDVTVELLNLPALMHEFWQQHAKSLLRDLLLLGIEVEASHEIEAHAAAMDALAILEEQVGRPKVSDAIPGSGTLETAPGLVRLKVRVVVPKDSLLHFDTLDRQLDTAVSHASAGRLLTPPTPPALDAFRRWMCEQVRVQADGRPPRPWTTPPDVLDQEHGPGDSVDLATVQESARAMIGSDRTGRIVAASPAALSLLKHDTPGDLVGARLLDVIPARFHQAHLAGLTVHQTTGGSPLMGLVVAVPAHCGDGTEVPVELTITASLDPDGGSIFVAELRPV